MALYYFHRILIAAAIIFDVGYTYFCLKRYSKLEQTGDLIMAIASSAVTLGFVIYLVRFNKKVRRLRDQVQAPTGANSQGGDA